jgi:UDP-3-O-[3-hydroxymyristoyl] glucosamine N-acyltransferase
MASIEFSAAQIASMLGGRVEGDPNTLVHGLSKIEEGKPGTLTFLANPKYKEFIYQTHASIAIVGNDFEAHQSLPSSLTLIKVNDAYAAFGQLLEAYQAFRRPKPGIHPSAVVADTAVMGAHVHIGAGVVVGEMVKIGEGAVIMSSCSLADGCEIGARTMLHMGVRIYHDCVIGDDCTIHSGAIIGADGFGFAPNSENQYHKVPQIGNVVIEDHVEIGAGTCIDRATLGSTIIRRGVKLDNLIQIAHNVEIGENTVIAAQSGVAGSTKIGKNCLIGGQVGIIGHLTIADGTKIAAQSGIGHSIEKPDTIVQGSPAFGIMDYKKSYVGFTKLPDLMKRIAALEKALGEAKS